MREPDNSLPLEHRFHCGTSGTGKSTENIKHFGKAKHVFVFDIKNEYGRLPGFRVAYTPEEFVRLVKGGGRVAFVAPPDQFEFFCRAVWLHGGCTCVVDELGAVTGTAKALDTWFKLETQGRGFGIKIIGSGQRAAEVDKTLCANLRVLHVRRHTLPSDQKRAAEMLGVPVDEVAALTGYEFIERDMQTGVITRSKPLPVKSAVRLPAAARPQRQKRR